MRSLNGIFREMQHIGQILNCNCLQDVTKLNLNEVEGFFDESTFQMFPIAFREFINMSILYGYCFMVVLLMHEKYKTIT